MPDTKDQPGLLGRTADSIKEYLHNKDTSFAPAIGAGLLGAGAGALLTEKKKGETTTQRALRTLRNAAVYGALGGAGAQALAYGLPQTAEAVKGETPAHTGDKGMGRSPLARSLYAAVHPMIVGTRNFAGAPAVKRLEQLVGANKLKEINIGTVDKPVNVPGHQPVPRGRNGTKGFFGYKPEWDAWKSTMHSMRSKTLTDAGATGQSANTARSVAEQIMHDNPRVGRDFGISPNMTPLEYRKATREAVGSYLKNVYGVGQESALGDAYRTLNRAINPLAFSRSRLSRGIGLASGVGLPAAAFFAPEGADKAQQYFGSLIGEDTNVLTPSLPNVGPNEVEKSRPWLLRGY